MPKYSDEEQPFDYDGSDYDEEKPKKKPKKMTGTKKKATEDADGSVKPKRAAKPKKPKITEPTPLDNGWIAHPTNGNLLYKPNPTAQGATKIAAFDLDGTLVTYKSPTRAFALDVNDWLFFNDTVPSKIKEFHNQGYQFIIFSNQGSIKTALDGDASAKVRGRVDNVVAAISQRCGTDIPFQVLLATSKDDYRKPSDGMWKFFCENMSGGVAPDIRGSFYVGDAAGRDGDILDSSDSDKVFAHTVGLKFMIPEDVFGSPPEMEDNDKVIIYFTKFANFLRKHANADNKWFYKAAPYSKLAEAITAMGATKLTSSKQIDVKGIGKKTKEKVDEFLSTGKVQEYEDLRIELEGDGTGGGEEGGGGGANKEGGAGAAIPVNKDAAMAMNFL